MATDGVVSASAALTAPEEPQTIQIRLGNAEAKEITVESDSFLQDIRDAINNAGAGVTASIVSDGSAKPYRLVLTADTTGLASTMQIQVSGEANTENRLRKLLHYDPTAPDPDGPAEIRAAQDAQLKINGLGITRPSNTINDALEGVTLTLEKTGTSMLSITQDKEAVEKNVGEFVKAYNDLQATLKSLSSYDVASKSGGALVGDGTVRSIQTKLRDLITSPPAGLAGSFTHLSNIGVGFQRDGKLALDADKLKKAMTDNFQDIGKLFAKTDTTLGYAGQLSKMVDGFLGTDGLIASRTDGLTKSIKTIGNDKEAMMRRLESVEKRYRLQFTALDTMIASMTSTSNYLTQQLANLNKL